MKVVAISDSVLRAAAAGGMECFVEAVYDAIMGVIGSLTETTMRELSVDQITLVGYMLVRRELLEGGFIQLIHNGYGAFTFVNPFARAMRTWGVTDFAKIINNAHKLYNKYHTALEREMSDEEFMALYEQYSEFDVWDDLFVAQEEAFTSLVACYVDDHLDHFVTVC